MCSNKIKPNLLPKVENQGDPCLTSGKAPMEYFLLSQHTYI